MVKNIIIADLTQTLKRLNPDKTPRDFSKPVNKVDEICMRHDIAYEEADKGMGTRHDADKTMLNELNELNNKEFNWNEFLAKYFTNGGNRCTVQVRTGIRRSPRIAQANET